LQTLKLRRISRYRWPLVITGALTITAVFSLSPLVDVANPGSPPAAALSTPLLYDLIAPASNILDTITILSPAQYLAVFVLCVVCFLAATLVRQRRALGHFCAFRTARCGLGILGGTVAMLGIVLIGPRPMATLVLSDPDLIAVDFHSHTEASHDGRAGFTAERNREWHRRSGFDAAYVTDHATFDGAVDGERGNPAVSGEGMVLLPGIELRDPPEHLLVIGVDPRRTKIDSPNWQGDPVAAGSGSVPPILLLVMPGDIEHIPPNEISGPIRLGGIEASDGSPRGLAQSATARDTILAASSRLDLALVAGSDNHGWGRLAPAWSVMRIPGWRGLKPAQLDVEIRRTILSRGSRSVQVIERRTAPPSRNVLQAGLGGVTAGIVMARTMSPEERVSWMAWSWGLCVLSLRRTAKNRKRRRAVLRARMKKRRTPRFTEEAAAIRVAS
jgi:hypothetical protein